MAGASAPLAAHLPPPARPRWRTAVALGAAALAVGLVVLELAGAGTPGLGTDQALLLVAAAGVAWAAWFGRRAARHYRALAILALNSAVLFLVLNLALALAYEIADHAPRRRPLDPVSVRYGALLRQVYPGRSEAEIHALLRVWNQPFAFAPYTQFRMRPYRSALVNVDAAGFRHGARQGPWPPERAPVDAVVVFVLGGSTTFGFGVADDETVPSHLQELLEVRLARPVLVYNFGCGLYYSTQERLLLDRLLAAGARPDAVVFIDGLNEFRADDEPDFSAELRRFLAGEVPPGPPFLAGWPVRRLADQLHRRLAPPPAAAPAPAPAAIDPEVVLDRYRVNLRLARLTAQAFGAEVFFVWQPVPMYGYDLRHHLFAPEEARRHPAAVGYPLVARRIAERWPDPAFVWCADLQAGIAAPLYVDQVHYGPDLSRRLAACIADGMAGWLPPPPHP